MLNPLAPTRESVRKCILRYGPVDFIDIPLAVEDIKKD